MKGLKRVKKRRGRLGRDYGNVRLERFTHEDYYAIGQKNDCFAV